MRTTTRDRRLEPQIVGVRIMGVDSVSSASGLSKPHRRLRIEIAPGLLPSLQPPESGRGNHRRVVSRQRQRGINTGSLARSARERVGSKAAIGRDTAGNADRLFAPCHRAAAKTDPAGSRRHTLEARAEIGDLGRRQGAGIFVRPDGPTACSRCRSGDHGGLQAAETEIRDVAPGRKGGLQVCGRRVAIGIGEARPRQVDRLSLPCCARRSITGPPG